MPRARLSASSQRGRKSQPCLSPPCSDSGFRKDLATLRATFSNFTANTSAELQALRSQGEPRGEADRDRGALGEAAPSPQRPPSPPVLQVAKCKK